MIYAHDLADVRVDFMTGQFLEAVANARRCGAPINGRVQTQEALLLADITRVAEWKYAHR